MVDRERVEQRLMKLEHTVRKLKELAAYSWTEYSQDEGLQDRAERNLQLAAQACIDLANHLIAEYGFRSPLTYAESFDVLREEGIIPPDLAENMQKIAGFRNILVHDYLKIDQQIVYSTLNRLQNFQEFAQCVYKLVE
ncbi:MAG: type VII toxin-antitoxin system HepT family RNase toxin [Peptococcia bacterium]